MLPCPFCGGTRFRMQKQPRFGPDTAKDEPEGWAYSVVCGGCAASGGWSKGPSFPDDDTGEIDREIGPSGARRWWNMRADLLSGQVLGESAVLRHALETIREHYGKVCADYMECHHASCASSYAAWALADEALEATKA